MTRRQTPQSTTSTTPAPGWVSFVGSGPGDPGLLTVRAVELLQSAEVIVTEAPAHLDLVRTVLGLAEGDAGPEIVDGGFGEDGQPLTHAARAKVVVRHGKKQRVVRLMIGDPFLYASGPEEAQACVKAGVGFEIVPGVSSVSAVPAYAGIPLTTKNHKEMAVVTCGDKVDWSAYADDRTLVLLSGVGSIGETAAALIEAGRSPETPVAITRVGTTTEQQTLVSTLADGGRRRARRTHRAAGRHRRRPGRRPAPDAVVVRDQAALRLACPGAAHQGAGRLAVASPARLRRGARGGADHLGRAAPQPAPDGQGRPRPGRGPLRVDRLHLGQRRQGRPREVRGVRPGRARVLRPQDRRCRRQDRRGHRRLGPARRPGARRASSPLPACSTSGRRTTTCSTRSTGSSCRAPTSRRRTSSPA